MRPMRVLFLTPSYPPMLGGAERYARALAKGLVRRGHQVTVLTSNARSESDFFERRASTPEPSQERGRLVTVIRGQVTGVAGGRTALTAWRKAMTLLSAMPGDQSRALMWMARSVPRMPALEDTLYAMVDHELVHCFNLSWENPLMAGWRFARQRGLPFVVTPFAHVGVGVSNRVARNNAMDHQRHVLADAEAVLAMTSVEREGLVRLGVSPQRLFVAGGGIDPWACTAEPRRAMKEVLRRYEMTGPLVLFVGRVTRDKGAIRAAEAVRLLRRRGVGVTLVLVGQIASEFRRYHRRLHQTEKEGIRTLGVIDEVAKSVLLSASTMLVLPSMVDSFGIVLLEAWAYGKPVIGARAGGIPGVIDDGEDGLLVYPGDVEELADAMALLLRDESLAQSMGDRGRQKLDREYSWSSVCDRVLEVYEHVLSSFSEIETGRTNGHHRLPGGG